MPAVKGGFKLKPSGFFNRNPCLDISPPPCNNSSDQSTETPTIAITPMVSKL
jgi:hypothetical protein